MLIHTPATYGFTSMWYSAIARTSVHFKVRACSDVSIILAEHFSITDYGVYEILIGGSNNTKSSIRQGIQGNTLVEMDTNDILHCSESRWFWISWYKGIDVGSGPYVGDIHILRLPMSNIPTALPVSAVAISTAAASDGDWEFTSVPGKAILIKLDFKMKGVVSASIPGSEVTSSNPGSVNWLTGNSLHPHLLNKTKPYILLGSMN